MPELIPAPDGDLCLAFVNTRYWRGSAEPTDELRGQDDLLRWVEANEKLPPSMLQRLRSELADGVFEEAVELREAIFRCFAATAAGRTPEEKDLALLNAALAVAPLRTRVQLGGWEVGQPAPSTAALLAPTLWSAADLLLGSQLARVRQCANPQCGWVFLDNSKSANRRWCMMSACGNRAKAQRHYQRSKEK